MPVLGAAKRDGLGPLGTLRSFVSVLREVSFDEVRDQAETVPRVLVLAPDASIARRIGIALTGAGDELAVTGRELNAPIADAERFDAIVVFDPERTAALARIRGELPASEQAVAIIGFEGTGPEDEVAIERHRARIASKLPERAPAFGRAFPPFRAAAAKAVIDETAKANAQFALISNLPAAVPIVGSLAAAGADFLVLTKNQLMMIFKLAAIHGRDLRDQWGIVQEMVPVVGAGFFWRTLAREAASFVPLAAGTIPKVVIAYAGTVSTGRAADLYYRTNRRPTREQMHGYYRQAAEAVKRLPLPLPGGAAKRAEGAAGPAAPSGDRQASDERIVRLVPPTADVHRTSSGATGVGAVEGAEGNPSG